MRIKEPVISAKETSHFETIPEVPIFQPEQAEFSNFMTYIAKIEQNGAHHMGLCKIKPPPSWHPNKTDYQNVHDVRIERPIAQIYSGTGGVYLQDARTEKSLSFKKFKKSSNSSRRKTPPHNNIDDLEAIYWSSIYRLQPMYGADVAGSLTDEDQLVCNISKLRSTLSDVLADENIRIGGVNTPYLYFGAWATTFAWHVEDMDLYSINYLHFGEPKVWYCIPPAFARKFEAFAREHFKADFLDCQNVLRHKCILIQPKVLAAAGIPTRRVSVQVFGLTHRLSVDRAIRRGDHGYVSVRLPCRLQHRSKLCRVYKLRLASLGRIWQKGLYL